MNDSYIVEVDALGFAGGCARKGELVTLEQVGAENVERLLLQHAISRSVFENPAEVIEAPAPGKRDIEPVSPALRLSVGLPFLGADLSDEERAWVADVKAGVVPVPFDADKVSDLSVKEIVARIADLGGPEIGVKTKKSEAVDALEEAVENYIGGLEVDETEDDGQPEDTETGETDEPVEDDGA